MYIRMRIISGALSWTHKAVVRRPLLPEHIYQPFRITRLLPVAIFSLRFGICGPRAVESERYVGGKCGFEIGIEVVS
jgi:hypothetical protein